MTKMTKAQAIKALNAIDGGDPEVAHSQADDILLAYVPEDVRNAYQALVKRCGWWASA